VAKGQVWGGGRYFGGNLKRETDNSEEFIIGRISVLDKRGYNDKCLWRVIQLMNNAQNKHKNKPLYIFPW